MLVVVLQTGRPVLSFNAEPAALRVAVLEFGTSHTGQRVTAKLRALFSGSGSRDFVLIDSDLTRSAVAGAGYEGSLNLTLNEARDLGSAMGVDFYLLGTAETVSRLPSTGPPYFESFATIFLVSARTGRLILWERPLARGSSADDAEKALLERLSTATGGRRYQMEIERAHEAEVAERREALAAPAAIIEVMSDEESSTSEDVRPPRPYRRLKPPYPESAATAEVEAVVDALVDIDAQGEVRRIQIARWAGYGLDESVVQTVRQMHFFPALRRGVAIPMRVLLRYNFRKPAPSAK